MRCPVVMPDLGLGHEPVTASVWLVELGQLVHEGDRLLEVLGESVTVDLPAPARGRLSEMLVEADDPLHAGQILGFIATDEESSSPPA
ncbi:MAG: hypothetical protein K1X74_12595 [Pirellulales bacterium]|nr:hypothetical protein [Pirellulales bacterium]